MSGRKCAHRDSKVSKFKLSASETQRRRRTSESNSRASEIKRDKESRFDDGMVVVVICDVELRVCALCQIFRLQVGHASQIDSDITRSPLVESAERAAARTLPHAGTPTPQRTGSLFQMSRRRSSSRFFSNNKHEGQTDVR